MSKLQMKLAIGRLTASALIAVLPIVGVAQTAPPCKALVQIKNSLWLVRADGTPIAQVTNDQQFRSAAALNPSGNVIAYSGKDAPNDVSLIDATGRSIADLDLQATSAITDLSWMTPTLLRAEEHLGRNGGRFHFVRLGPGNIASPLPASDAEGTSCAVSPDGKDMACIIASAAVELNGRDVHRSTDPFASASTVQSVDVAVGTGVVAATSPAFRVDVKGISHDNTVQLRITTPDGHWSEQYVPSGSVMDVRFDGDSDPAPLYGVMPAATTNVGVVRLHIKRSSTGSYSFEGGIAWDPRGKRMAVVEVNGLGQRTWILLNREMGQAATAATGAIDAKEPLPIDGPIRSISFTSDTRLRIEGASQVFEKDLPPQGKVRSGGPYAITQAKPQQLTVKLGGGGTLALVKGWSCQ